MLLLLDYKSERKYWHNVYHHLDRSPVVDEAIYVVSSSLSRQTLISLENFDLKCLNLEFRKLLQVHSFYENDFQKVWYSKYVQTFCASDNILWLTEAFYYLHFEKIRRNNFVR